MNLLLPFDFSETARHAARYAATLAPALRAHLTLLFVYIPPVTRGNMAYPLLTEEMARQTAEAQVQLDQWADELRIASAHTFDTRVRTAASVLAGINEEAAEGKFDWIVMGTQGASGLGKYILGSNTANLLTDAPCPVLVVPPDCPLQSPQRIVFATDFHDGDMTVVLHIASLCRAFHAALLLVHVSEESQPSERDLIEQFSKAIARETRIPQPYYYVMSNHDPARGIDAFARAIEADLIALAKRKRNFLQRMVGSSVTEKMAYRTHQPLLVLPDPGAPDEDTLDDF